MSADSYYDCPKCGGEDTVREDYEQGRFKVSSGWIYFVDHADECSSCDFVRKTPYSKKLIVDEPNP